MQSENRGLSWKLFCSFLKIGLFTFGGGYAMIPLIQNEVVNNKGWVEKDRFLDLLVLAQSAPGPVSLNTAVFVGYNLNKWRGAVASILGVVLPSFVILLMVAMFFADIKSNKVVEAVFKGMRPAVVALIAAPILGLAKGMNIYKVVIAILVAFAIWKLSFSPVWFIVIGATGGIMWMLWKRKRRSEENMTAKNNIKENLGENKAKEVYSEGNESYRENVLETPPEEIFEDKEL